MLQVCWEDPVRIGRATGPEQGATMGDHTTTELDRILAALAAGDQAFVFTLVTRYGDAVTCAARDRGVPDDVAAEVVGNVAFALLGRPLPAGRAAWDVVVAALDEVLAGLGPPEPPPGTGPRTVHLVDIENLAGGPERVHRWFAPALRQYESVARPHEGDHVVLAADASVWTRTAWEVDPRWDYRFGTGPDGADRVLLERADPDWVVARFERLVVGSGDHAFAPLVAEVRDRGVDAVVVARPRQLAGVLRRTGARVVALPDLPPIDGGEPGTPVVLAA